MKARPILFLSAVILGALSLHAQSNQVVDSLLAQPQAGCAETAYLVLVGGHWIEESSSPGQALQFAQGKGWLPRSAQPATPIDLSSFSFLAMKGLRLRGGFGWTLLPVKRYALRELVALGVANASGGGTRILSGDEVVRMLGKLALAGGIPK